MTVHTEKLVVPGRRLGKHEAANDHRDLLLANYLTSSLPTPPATEKLSAKVPSWPMYLNDQLGDCAIACPAHEIECWTANAGVEHSITDNEVLKAYEAVSGYRSGHPETDVGCVVNDVLNYWRKTGIGGDRIAGFVKVSATSTTLVKTAMWLFGGVYVGAQLPKAAQAQVDAGKPWTITKGPDAAPGSWGGHAFPIVDYDVHGPVGVTWGGLQRMTWTWLHKYADECFAVLSADWVDQVSRKAPSGVDYAALQADLSKFGNPG